ncbi:hypothetical protein BC938DRAFT_479813 [Jimgerdemannia flammicorona]|uniref:MACPF domain-containing protein n=1 Tax=Jimgerdemannia flammicorona TaxID=994334 RepID=A0A433QK52_9FUNG|nr:hypothetical protein BC938DRAFT_479813 [Jimgerdemannia flammicorona]
MLKETTVPTTIQSRLHKLIPNPRMVDIPTIPSELVAMVQRDPDSAKHPGYYMAQRSVSARRSPNNPTILLVGVSGAGKSTTINRLFGSNICVTGGIVSVTKNVTEYYVDIPSERCGINNLRLSIIDTPGFGDSHGGPDSDAKHAVCMKRFFETHEGLNKGIFPSAILIICPLTDTRMGGESSAFTKMLHAVRFTIFERAVDLRRPNVVFVLTHLNSILGDAATIEQHLEARRATILETAQRVLGLNGDSVRIIAVENECGQLGYSKMEGTDWYELRTGELFPYHLFRNIIETTKSAEDDIGEEAISLYFSDHGDARVKKGHRVSVRQIVKDGKDEIARVKKIIEHIAIGNKDSEIWQALDAQINKLGNGEAEENEEEEDEAEEEEDEEEDEDEDEDELEENENPYKVDAHFLATLLHVKGITSKADLPESMSEFVALLDNVELSPHMLELVRQTFGIRQYELIGNLVVGHGYHAIKDGPTTTQVFDHGPPVDATINFAIPKRIKVTKTDETKVSTMTFDTQEAYNHKRMIDLGILKKPGNSLLQSSIGATNPPKSKPTTTQPETQLLVQERRTFKLSIDPATTPLNPEFKLALSKLPTKYDKGNKKWTEFFEKWGTHAIVGAYGGGSMMISLTASTIIQNSNPTTTTTTTTTDIKEKFSPPPSPSVPTVPHFQPAPKALDITSSRQHVVFRGGDAQYYTKRISDLTDNMQGRWVASIPANPVVLTRDLELIPFTILTAMDVDLQHITEAMVAATRAYLGRDAQVDPRALAGVGDQNQENEIPKTRQQATRETSPVWRFLSRVLGLTAMTVGGGAAAVGGTAVALHTFGIAGALAAITAVVGAPVLLAVGGVTFAAGGSVWIVSRLLSDEEEYLAAE